MIQELFGRRSSLGYQLSFQHEGQFQQQFHYIYKPIESVGSWGDKGADKTLFQSHSLQLSKIILWYGVSNCQFSIHISKPTICRWTFREIIYTVVVVKQKKKYFPQISNVTIFFLEVQKILQILILNTHYLWVYFFIRYEVSNP